MRFSEAFAKTRKEAPKDEVSKNAILLTRAGFIDKLSAGVYSFLPMGFRVLKKIEHIIREEMDAIGGQELFLPSLHPKKNWQKTGRWDTMDDLYKVKDASNREFALGPTHEEVIVPLAKQFISSYKDLPVALYQIQNKFRSELRAKSGLLRGREFLMKDLYSFHADESDFLEYYERVKQAYKNIFERVGIGNITHLTFASGGSFSKHSHEFQTLTPAGEDTIYLCESCAVAINDEIIKEQSKCPECGKNKESLKEERAIEVGNIFPLKTKFSEMFDLKYKDKNGELKLVIMGCYGIGIGRLMGAIVEITADDKGMVWPESVAPFDVHIIEIASNKVEVRNKAEKIYQDLQDNGKEVLYDDRDISAGEKFADADLIGIPRQIIVSEKTLGKEDVVEMKERKTGESKIVKFSEIII